MRTSITARILLGALLLALFPSRGEAQKIRVLVYYTPAAASTYPAIRQHIRDYAIDIVNTVYSNSATSGQTMPTLELAGIKAVNYTEEFFYAGKAIDSMSKSTGVFTLLAQTRDLYAADVVLLAGNNWLFWGSGYMKATQAKAFASANVGNMVTDYLASHEIGHVFGCDHDPANAGTLGYSYGYGHVATIPGKNWGDAMSYAVDRRPFLSSPSLWYDGEPRGTSTSNCTQVHSDYYGTLEAFRSPMSSAVMFSDTIGAQEFADVVGTDVSTSGSVLFASGSEGRMRASGSVNINPEFQLQSGKLEVIVGPGALAKSARGRGGQGAESQASPVSDAFSLKMREERGELALAYTLPEGGALRVSVSRVTGESVRVKALGFRASGSHTENVSLGALEAGIYVVRVTADKKSVTRRLYLGNP